MSPPRSATPAVLAGLVALWLCWGTSFPAMRVMVATLPPLLASGAVFLVAGVLLGLSGTPLRRLDGPGLRAAAGVGACLLGAQGAVAVALRHVDAGTAAVLVAAIPLWVVVLRAVSGDRPDRGGVLRLVLGFVGVAGVLVGSSVGSDGSFGWSVWGLVVVAAAVVWAAGTLWASRSPAVPSVRGATAVQLVVGGALLLAAGVVSGEPAVLGAAVGADATGALVGAVGGASWAAFGYLVLVDSLAGFALYTWLLRSAPVALVSTYAYVVPVVAYVVGVVVLGEPFRLAVLPGAALILAAVAAELRSSRPSRTDLAGR